MRRRLNVDSDAHKLFRKEALESEAVPERLDRTLCVANSKAWLGIGVLTVIVASVLSWSVIGEISTFVPANGILLSRDGSIRDAVSPVAGTLDAIHVQVGDTVERGALLGRIVHEENEERYRSALALVAERKEAIRKFQVARAAEDKLVSENLARRRDRLQRTESNRRRAVRTAREQLERHRSLFDERIVTRVTLERSRQQLDRAERELFGTLREIDEINAQELRRRHDHEAQVEDLEERLSRAKRQANELKVGIDSQRIAAPASGKVIEIKAAVGTILRLGEPVVSIDTGTTNLEVLLYIPPEHGKRVRPGMSALVSPSTARREEYGSIRGTVRTVSAFPITFEGIAVTLRNQTLAEVFVRTGPPYEGRIELEADSAAASGFAWTSPKGGSKSLSSGTLASVEIKVASQPPISLAIPLLKKTMGL